MIAFAPSGVPLKLSPSRRLSILDEKHFMTLTGSFESNEAYYNSYSGLPVSRLPAAQNDANNVNFP
jgi:hypothetical protein